MNAELNRRSGLCSTETTAGIGPSNHEQADWQKNKSDHHYLGNDNQ
jgi:hypothetical protein